MPEASTLTAQRLDNCRSKVKSGLQPGKARVQISTLQRNLLGDFWPRRSLSTQPTSQDDTDSCKRRSLHIKGTARLCGSPSGLG